VFRCLIRETGARYAEMCCMSLRKRDISELVCCYIRMFEKRKESIEGLKVAER
jgi:hypothetical protein